MTIGIFALPAQQEREMISERTKKALQAKKEQGYKLGKADNFNDDMRKKGREAHHLKAIENENNRCAYSFIQVLRKQKVTYRSIATKLNDSGFKTSINKKFYANSVRQIQIMFER